jgi:hypothetical protein
MRHLLGVVLAAVLAAVVFFVASWGYIKLLLVTTGVGTPPAAGGSLWHARTELEAFGALLAFGVVAGVLIATPWISPLASGLPGLALLAWTGLYLSDVHRAVRYIPLRSHPYGTGFEAMLVDGVLAMAGLAMIIPLFVPSRWRRRARRKAAETGYQPYPDLQATQTVSSESGLLSDWTQTSPQPRIYPDTPGNTRPTGQSEAPWGPAEYS